MATYTWQPERFIHYPQIEHVNLSPDGRLVLFTIRTAYMTAEASEFRHQVMLARTDGAGEATQLTFGRSATHPQWSPDGRFIAFIRKGEGEKAQPGLWAMHAGGGEAWPLTGAENQVKNAVQAFRWSRDGRRVAFVAVPWDEEKERRQKARDDALRWRVDYDFAHLHVLDFTAAPDSLPQVTLLTRGRLAVGAFDWSPDGSRIAFSHTPAPLFDLWPQSRLATIAADGSEREPRDVGLLSSWGAAPAYSPDGCWIASDVGAEGAPWAYAGRMTLFPAGGSGESRRPVPLADVPDEQPNFVGWAPDSRAVYVMNHSGTASELVALPVDGSPGAVRWRGEKVLGVCHCNAQGQVALVGQDFHEPNGVYVADLAASEGSVPLRKVAEPPMRDWPEAPLPQVRLLRWKAPDGLDVEGILYLPAGYADGGERLPLLLHVHGGPASIFQRAYAGTPYYYTPAALCERGVAVLRCNPRGSGGYGHAFRLANRRDWGGGDFRDLMQGVDLVIARGIADPDRLGICGWSYGGYMTSWTIGQTGRFKAASIGAAVTNLVSFNGTSDIPSFIPDYFGAEFWEDFELYRDRSPMFHVANVATPAIIQHGECDVRVPLEQGLQFFNALQRRGVPVEMYIYPRQDHAILEPRLLIDAARRNLEWFAKMIGGEMENHHRDTETQRTD